MSTIARGSLAFTGYGDAATMKFHAPDGTDLGQPASTPVEPGAGVDGIVALKTSHRVCIVGGNSPHFGTTGIGIFNPDLTVHAQGVAGAGNHDFPGRSIARDDSDHFYGNQDSIPIASYIDQYDGDGNQTGAWHVTAADSLQGLAVNSAGTIAYYVSLNSLNTVRAWDLSGDTDLGIFVTGAAGYSVDHNGLLCIGTDLLVGWAKSGAVGYVTRYSAAAATLAIYTLSGTNPAPHVLTYGLTDASFWLSYYDSALSTSSQARLVEITVSSGAVLHDFHPDDGAGFEYDGPFTVLRVAIGTPSTTPPTPQIISDTPCCHSAPTGLSVPGPHEAASTWTPECTGGGTVPTASDLTDAENWAV